MLFRSVCGRASKGTFPASVPQAVQYGPVVKTWASYFTNQHHIAVERTTEIFADLVQHRVSEATVLTASEQLERCIAPATEAVKALLREAETSPSFARLVRHAAAKVSAVAAARARRFAPPPTAAAVKRMRTAVERFTQQVAKAAAE